MQREYGDVTVFAHVTPLQDGMFLTAGIQQPGKTYGVDMRHDGYSARMRFFFHTGKASCKEELSTLLRYDEAITELAKEAAKEAGFLPLLLFATQYRPLVWTCMIHSGITPERFLEV